MYYITFILSLLRACISIVYTTVIYRRVTRSANGFTMMKKQYLSSFVAGQGTLVPCIFMCFSTNFQTSSCGFFVCFCIFSFDEIACISSILRNELKRFASGAVLSFAKKKSQLASNFKLTRTSTIYGEHGIIALII